MRLGILALLLVSKTAWAGFVEIGASANYRSSGFDKRNYAQTLSYTTSFSYYFWEMCAWEINYTTGYTKQVTQTSEPLAPKTTIEDNFEMISMDLVLSFASRKDPIRPYIKMGGGYLTKERFRQVNDDAKTRISEQSGGVPNGGAGLAINITKELSLKLGVDAWTSPLNQKPVIVDYAGRAGFAWIF